MQREIVKMLKGKTVKSIIIDDLEVQIYFDDGSKIELSSYSKIDVYVENIDTV